MRQYSPDIAIIGAGSAGLAAAIEVKKKGMDVLILERDRELGGITLQCIHNGFGLHEFKEELTGPEYIQRFINQVKELNIPYKLNTMVIELTNDKKIYAVNEDGSLAWRFPTRAEIIERAAICEGVIYFGSGDRNLYAVTIEGELLWRFRANGPLSTTPTFHRDTVYFGSYDGNLYAVSRKDGRLLWRFPTKDIVVHPSEVVGGRIYIGSCDNNLYAVDAETGGLLWKFETKAPVASYPLATGHAVYIGSWDCHMYAVDPETGRLLWKFQTSMSNMATIEVEQLKAKKTVQTMWTEGTEREKKGEAREEGISDYGEFKGAYIDTAKTDYVMGGKKGYKSG